MKKNQSTSAFVLIATFLLFISGCEEKPEIVSDAKLTEIEDLSDNRAVKAQTLSPDSRALSVLLETVYPLDENKSLARKLSFSGLINIEGQPKSVKLKTDFRFGIVSENARIRLNFKTGEKTIPVAYKADTEIDDFKSLSYTIPAAQLVPGVIKYSMEVEVDIESIGSPSDGTAVFIDSIDVTVEVTKKATQK